MLDVSRRQIDPQMHGEFASVSSNVAHVEKRAEARIMTIYRLVRLTSKSGESFAIARNISEGGIMLQAAGNFVHREKIVVGLSDDLDVTGEIVWADATQIGITFDKAIDVAAVLARSKVSDRSETRRAPRIGITECGELSTGDQRIPVVLCDVSQYGARVMVEEDLDRTLPYTIVAAGSRSVPCKVRWQFNGFVGLEFEQAIPMNDMLRKKTSRVR